MRGKEKAVKIDRFVIQFQPLRREEWYDDPAFSSTISLTVAQAKLQEPLIMAARKRGIRYRIVKRKVVDTIVG